MPADVDCGGSSSLTGLGRCRRGPSINRALALHLRVASEIFDITEEFVVSKSRQVSRHVQPGDICEP